MLTIEGGTITENIASDKGGAIYNKGTLAVSGGCIINNISKDGGGIYNTEDGTADICGYAQITANKTTELGGGGITNLGTLSVSDNASVSYNYGYSNGGGIRNGGTATVTGGSITDNSAGKSGSGICNQGTLNMQGTPLVKDNMGDDVYLPSSKTITITGSFSSGARIGVSSASEKPIVTSGYGSYNLAQASNYFFENGTDCVSVIESGGEVKLNTDGIVYVKRSWDAEKQFVTKELSHLTNYITVSGSLGGLSSDNWYVVKGNITVDSRIDNRGKANLLLCDGASIEFKEGIRNQNNIGSELNIYAQQSGTGKLSATGTYDIAAIGSEDEEKSGTINIYGGVISTVYGIGGAYECAGGIVRIYGAEVKSREIGCGSNSPDDSSAYIGIFNSTLTAAIHNGAGVLDFYNSVLNNSGVLTFSEAEVGAHKGCKKMGDINIVNSYIDASTKIGQGAAIGSCEGCDAGNIRIINSTVNAHSVKDSVYGYGYGAAIGGGKGGNIVIDHSCVVASAYSGAAIGGGKDCSGGSVSITDSVVMTSAYMGGAGIGGGDSGDSGSIRITDSEVEATGGEYSAGIGGGDEGGCNDITIINSDVTATGGDYAAGIGSGDEGKKMETITIIDSTVTASSKDEGAGIGGGDNGDGGTISITCSTVTATGGKDGAGIGGGEGGSGGTIEINKSTVTAAGKSCGAGIGCGESGSKTEIKILNESTVEATSGGSGYAAAIGDGDYTFVSADVSTYIDKGLAVIAGSSSSDTERYIGQDRYNAVWNSKYAKIYPCEHPTYAWCYENSAYHRKKCTDCGLFFGDYEQHDYNSENVCTVCGASAVMATLTFIEKNSAGDEVTTGIEAPKYTEYSIPACSNVPDGMAFIGWQIEDEEYYYEPGDTVQVSNVNIIALYLPVVTAQFIDSEGVRRTVQARQLSDDIVYLSAGWYVADSDIDYSRFSERTVIAGGDVRIILADGVTVTMGDSTGNSSARAIQAKNSLSTLSIYGQAEQSGVIRCDNNRIQLANFNMYGGSLLSTGDVSAAIDTNFVRGTLETPYFNSLKGFTFSGGSLLAERFITDIDNQLGWTNLSDSIRFNEINTLRKGAFTIAGGQAFTDGESIYTGTLTPEQVTAMQGKTLTPYQLHHFGEPEWTWSEDYKHATALFKCTDCDYVTEVEGVITSEGTEDRVVYTATAEFNGETYTDESIDYSDGIGARLVGHSISLEGDIAINFYMELSDSVIAHKDTAYLHFTIPIGGGTDTQDMLVKDARLVESGSKTYYVFKCRVAAKEMTSQIKAQMIDGDLTGTEYTYSVKEYADYLLEHADEREDLKKAVPLVKSMLNYGAYAQIYFDKNPGKLANADLDDRDKVLGDVTFTAPGISFDLPDGVTFEGATLSLKSETTLSLYFKSSTTLTFSCGDYTVEKASSGGYQVARIRGIKAKHIGSTFTLTVNGGTVTYSPLNYCKNVLPDLTASQDEVQNQQDEKLQNVVKALYLYWQAANAYFPE